MIVLVVNAGSSTLKSQLIDSETKQCLMKANAEKIATPGAFMNVSFPPNTEKHYFEMGSAQHADCLGKLLEVLTSSEESPISSLDEIGAIGNRVVSGGEYFDKSVLVDDDVLEKVKICGELAPLHNPAAASCIEYMRDATPSIPQVVVFDTAFHLAGLPPKAYRYALPERCYTDYRIRRYGAHGTSHKYAAETAAQMLGKDVTELNVIICHLGSGGSVSAVRGGQCVDTTMGFTPLEGIMMGTRAGSIDPAIVTYIMRRENATPDEVDALLNTESGMLGVSGYSNDYRELEDAAARGSESAQMALEMYIYTIQKAIGQFFAVLPGTDAIVMTAGIGENSATARSNICQGLEQLGIKLDPERNRGETYDRIISSDDSPVKVLVVCADEEMCIARETAEIVEAL